MSDYKFIRRSIRWMAGQGFFNWMPDEPYLKMKYWACLGKKLDLNNPKTFNEKLQWLKLHDHKPEYSRMVDKSEAKILVADKIGEQYIIPTLGVWDKFEDIDFSSLPNQFVLKCTHDSGGLAICHDKATFDVETARIKINRSLKKNYYLQSREWPYKNVQPRIIAEQYMEDTETGELRNYKIFTFDGIPKSMFIEPKRQSAGTKADCFDMEFKHLDFTLGYPYTSVLQDKPECFVEMVRITEQLTAGTTEFRVDFYQVNGKSYFGEITIFDVGGFDKFDPESWNEKLGAWIQLPEMFGGGYYLTGEKYLIWVHMEKKCCRELKDYKVWCFHGVPKMILVCSDRFSPSGLREDFYDCEWNRLDCCRPQHKQSENIIRRPDLLSEMLLKASELAAGLPFSRIDFYQVNGQLKFGEITFFPSSGFQDFIPETYDTILGEWLSVT